MLLRPADAADADALHHISIDAIRTSAAGHYSAAQLEAWCGRRSVDSHRQMIEEATVIVAEVDGRPVGFTSVVVERHELDQLFVLPAAGGRGVGRGLLAATDELAAAAGLVSIDARASRRALAAFQAAGYVVVGEETVTIDGQRLDRSHVRKRISGERP